MIVNPFVYTVLQKTLNLLPPSGGIASLIIGWSVNHIQLYREHVSLLSPGQLSVISCILFVIVGGADKIL